MNKSDYCQIPYWAISELGLKGNDLIIFGLIHGFTKDGETWFKGRTPYIQKWINASKNTVLSSINYLLENGLIDKKNKLVDGVNTNFYRVPKEVIESCLGGGAEIEPPKKRGAKIGTRGVQKLNGRGSEIGSDSLYTNNTSNRIDISDFEEKSQTEILELDTEEVSDYSENYSEIGVYFSNDDFEQQKETKKKVAPKKKELDLFGTASLWPSFDEFWDLYDKKTGRDKSEKKWEKLKQSEKEKIMGHIPDYIASQPDKTYRKNPETYLNGKCWNDEIIVKGKKMDGIDQILRENGMTLTDLANFRL